MNRAGIGREQQQRAVEIAVLTEPPDLPQRIARPTLTGFREVLLQHARVGCYCRGWRYQTRSTFDFEARLEREIVTEADHVYLQSAARSTVYFVLRLFCVEHACAPHFPKS